MSQWKSAPLVITMVMMVMLLGAMDLCSAQRSKLYPTVACALLRNRFKAADCPKKSNPGGWCGFLNRQMTASVRNVPTCNTFPCVGYGQPGGRECRLRPCLGASRVNGGICQGRRSCCRI